MIAALAMSLIVALRYFLASGLFAWLTERRFPGLHQEQRAQIKREIAYSLISTVIYGAPAGIVFYLWQHRGMTLIYTDFALYSWWYLPLSLAVYLLVQDTWFYWSHRAMHRYKALFRLAHAVHHQSRPPTAWTAMSFHPAEAVSGAIVVPLLVFLVPIHIAMLGAVLAIATVMAVINHMGWELLPRAFVHSRLGGWLISASHHEKHHEDYGCNFGLYFRLWDHLCGTDRGLTGRFEAQEESA